MYFATFALPTLLYSTFGMREVHPAYLEAVQPILLNTCCPLSINYINKLHITINESTILKISKIHKAPPTSHPCHYQRLNK